MFDKNVTYGRKNHPSVTGGGVVTILFKSLPDLNLFIFNKTCSDGESRSLGLLRARSHQLQPVLKPHSAMCFRLFTADWHPGTKPGAARVDIKSREDSVGHFLCFQCREVARFKTGMPV